MKAQTNRVINQSPSPKILFKQLKRKATKPNSEITKNYEDAQKVINGEYGNGETRKLRLGARYAAVQSVVNQILNGTFDYSQLSEKREYTGEIVKNTKGLAEISALKNKHLLQSYSFTLSKEDIDGSFSITLFPGEMDLNNCIDILDVVEIYESSIESGIRRFDEKNNEVYDTNETPVFIGVVKSKQYVSQVTDGGILRRFQIKGIAVTGLIRQFYLNLDTTATAITKQINSVTELNKTLATKLLKEPGTDLPLAEAVKTIWEKFTEIAAQCGTPAIESMINTIIGGSTDKIFDIDDSAFHYPLACIFNGEQTQDFYSLIDGLVPEPVYEKFAYMDSESKTMRVKIRTVPFSPANWNSLHKNELEANVVKSFSLTESDNEVYTVFFTYLNGYPKDEAFLMRIATLQDNKSNPNLVWNESKYKVYGYRPLIAHFIGYGLPKDKKESDDTTTADALKSNSEKMREWFGQLDEMLSGSFSLAMTYGEKPIMPGEKILFLDCEFYVEGITHTWDYGNGGDISISVSRGGKYENGVFSRAENLTKNMKLLEKAKNG